MRNIDRTQREPKHSSPNSLNPNLIAIPEALRQGGRAGDDYRPSVGSRAIVLGA